MYAASSAEKEAEWPSELRKKIDEVNAAVDGTEDETHPIVKVAEEGAN